VPGARPETVQAQSVALHDMPEAELALHAVAKAQLVDVLADRGAGFGRSQHVGGHGAHVPAVARGTSFCMAAGEYGNGTANETLIEKW